MTVNDSDPLKPERRWYQFSLRTLLIVVLVPVVVVFVIIAKELSPMGP